VIELADCSWPMARAGEAMKALADRAGLACRSAVVPDAPGLEPALDREAARTWVRALGAFLHIDVELAPLPYAELSSLLPSGPALIQTKQGEEIRVLAVYESARGKLELIAPGMNVIRVSARELRSALAGRIEREIAGPLTKVLHESGVEGNARDRVLDAMLEERLAALPVADVWRLRTPATAGLAQQLRQAGALKQLASFLMANAIEYTLWIVAWILAGRWALAGRFDTGWLLAWGLVLLTIAPVHALAAWNQSKLAIASGWVMMRLLLEGAFRLDPEDARYQGVGQLLGRVLDTEALHSLALTGGLTGLIAVLQLFAAALLLAWGANAPWLAIVLAGWIVVTLSIAMLYYRRRRDWTTARLQLTHDTSERMVGHRTRIAQQAPEKWHQGEDELLAHYVGRSRKIDWLAVLFGAVLPRAWLIAGISVMAYGVVDGTTTAPLLTAQLGGILLAHNSLRALGAALAGLSGAAISFERLRDLLAASKRVEAPGDPAIAVAIGSPTARPLLEMRDVTYRYPRRTSDAVKHSTVAIGERDRVLVQGSSGSGKSTWGSLASGFRLPESGLLFLRGFDRKTLGGREWRKRVVSAPQFHENYTLSGSLAFNLLMGREWPPDPKDLAEAEQVCRELGLGPLLASMPAGLMQMVGETGWQLSNGEKSRVYLARAILQRSELIVLDESFAALDPETAQLAMDCVLRRAPSLVCIAHV
jgi:ATP-binding cassette subfamily B protein